MSDRVAGAPSLETRMDDVRAVIDAAGAERAAVIGWSEGVAMSTLFASTYPDRVWALVLYGASARELRAPDYPWGPTEAEALRMIEEERRASELPTFAETVLDTAGDGFFASFDRPARAVRCAKAIVDAVHELGIDVRSGLHTGECELVDGKVSGIAVHTGARVAAHAGPGEVLVSGTVKDLVAGSGLEFEDRGTHELKGIPGEWRLYAAV